jgi:S-formylglutathione hydrolase
LLVSACHSAGMNLGFNQREGYDHSYLFVSSFMENHLRFHHGILSMVV